MSLNSETHVPDQVLTEDDKARLQAELKKILVEIKKIEPYLSGGHGLTNTWMNLEIDRRHIMRELHAGRRLMPKEQDMEDLNEPFELDTE